MGIPQGLRQRALLPVIGLVALFVALVSWAFASPVGSAPDDDFHIANIYCLADGTTCLSQQPRQGGDPRAKRALPCFVTNGTDWYAPDARVPADCLNDEDPADNTPGATDRLGYYPQVYYRAASLLVLDSIRSSVVAIRVANILVALALALGAIALSRPEHRQPQALMWLVSSVPLGAFLIASINPSAWAIIGTAAVIGPLIALISTPWSVRVSVPRLAFVVACAAMAVGSRSEGFIHLGLALMVAVVLGARWPSTRRGQVTLAVGAGAVALAAGFVIIAQQTRIRALVGVVTGASGTTPTTPLWDGLLHAPWIYASANSGPLGWLEITMPAMVTVLAGAAYWGSGFHGLSAMPRRKAAALLLLVTAMLSVAALLQQRVWIQPRYLLPAMFVLSFAMLAPGVGGSFPRLSRAQNVTLVLFLGIANSAALLTTTVRYVSGLTPGASSPLTFVSHAVPAWWWQHWISPFANWLLGSIMFMAACALLLLAATRHVQGIDPALPPEDPATSTRAATAEGGVGGSSPAEPDPRIRLVP